MPELSPALRKQLLQMSPAQLDEVRAFASMIKGNGAKVASSVKEAKDEDLHRICLDVIVTTMRARGADFSSDAMLRKTSAYKSFQKKLDEQLIEYMRTITKKNRIGLRALLAIAIDLLYRNLTDMGLPISSRTMMSHIHRLPAVINASFPGYASAGMLHLIVRKEEAHGKRRGKGKAVDHSPALDGGRVSGSRVRGKTTGR